MLRRCVCGGSLEYRKRTGTAFIRVVSALFLRSKINTKSSNRHIAQNSSNNNCLATARKHALREQHQQQLISRTKRRIPVRNMAWRCSASSHASLISRLEQSGILRTQSVINALLSVDRAYFISSSIAYADSPQPLSDNATISAPHMHATALELLASSLSVPGGARALDVGAGSGYMCAAMLAAASEGSRVWGVEHVGRLARLAVSNLRAWNEKAVNEGRVTVVEGDGRSGVMEGAPYDAVHVGAAAPEVPKELIKQMRIGGKMVVPVGPDGGTQRLLLVTKTGDQDGDFEEKEVCYVRYVPLCSVKEQTERWAI